jgi:hypothetical protein
LQKKLQIRVGHTHFVGTFGFMTALSGSRAVVQFNGIAAQLVLGRNNVKKTNNTSASKTSSDATAVSATAGLVISALALRL